MRGWPSDTICVGSAPPRRLWQSLARCTLTATQSSPVAHLPRTGRSPSQALTAAPTSDFSSALHLSRAAGRLLRDPATVEFGRGAVCADRNDGLARAKTALATLTNSDEHVPHVILTSIRSELWCRLQFHGGIADHMNTVDHLGRPKNGVSDEQRDPRPNCSVPLQAHQPDPGGACPRAEC